VVWGVETGGSGYAGVMGNGVRGEQSVSFAVVKVKVGVIDMFIRDGSCGGNWYRDKRCCVVNALEKKRRE